MSGKKVLRVGIGGYGRSGCAIHARWLREDQKRFQVVAVADQLKDRRQDAVDEFGCKVYKDYTRLLARENIDLFLNALPSDLHVKGTRDAFAAGNHVVCEKPLGRTTKEFDRMVAASKAAGKKLLPFQNSRFYAFFRKAREVIDSGVFGDILHVRMVWGGFGRRWDWQTLQEHNGGNLLNTGPHPMDHAVVLLKGRKPKVCCQMKSIQPFGGDAEDYCNITLYGRNLPTIEVVLSSYAAYPAGDQINVQGTLGGLTGGATHLSWRYFDPAKAPKQKFWKPWSDDRRYCSEALPWVEKTWKPSKRDQDGFLSNTRAFYNHAYDVLVNRKAPVIKLSEVRRQVELIQECHRQNPLPKRKKKR